MQFDKPELMADFRKLDAELKAEGIFDPSYAHVAMRMAELIAMLALGVYVMYKAAAPGQGFTGEGYRCWSADTLLFYSGFVIFGI